MGLVRPALSDGETGAPVHRTSRIALPPTASRATAGRRRLPTSFFRSCPRRRRRRLTVPVGCKSSIPRTNPAGRRFDKAESQGPIRSRGRRGAEERQTSRQATTTARRPGRRGERYETRDHDLALRCALCARFSSDRQRAASIEDRFRVCRVRPEREGWKIVGACRDAAVAGDSAILRPGVPGASEGHAAGRVRDRRRRGPRPGRGGGRHPGGRSSASCSPPAQSAARRTPRPTATSAPSSNGPAAAGGRERPTLPNRSRRSRSEWWDAGAARKWIRSLPAGGDLQCPAFCRT